MIKQIEIINWQSHKNTVVPLAPGVNMLVGDTESGKSAILKNVDWVINNRPGGEDLEGARSNWSKKKGEARGTITKDTATVSRIKSNSNNEYRLNGESFKAFGQGVPPEVQTALNIGSINIQRQEDKQSEGRHLFLLTANSGEIARYLNKIVDLDVIHKAESKIETLRRDTKAKLDTQKETLKTQQAGLKTYSDLPDRERDIDALLQLERESTTLKRSLDRLIQLNSAIDKENQRLVPLLKRLHAEKEINRLLETVQSLSTDVQWLRMLSYLTEEIQANKRICNSLAGIIGVEKQVNGLLTSIEEAQRLREQHDTLLSYGRLIADAKADAKRYEQRIVETTKQFNALMPEQCPLCGK